MNGIPSKLLLNLAEPRASRFCPQFSRLVSAFLSLELRRSNEVCRDNLVNVIGKAWRRKQARNCEETEKSDQQCERYGRCRAHFWVPDLHALTWWSTEDQPVWCRGGKQMRGWVLRPFSCISAWVSSVGQSCGSNLAGEWHRCRLEADRQPDITWGDKPAPLISARGANAIELGYADPVQYLARIQNREDGALPLFMFLA